MTENLLLDSPALSPKALLHRHFGHLHTIVDLKTHTQKDDSPLPPFNLKEGEQLRTSWQPSLTLDLPSLKESVIISLNRMNRFDLSEKLIDCHTYETVQVCTSCKKATRYWNRCENFFCPSCQPRLARDRQTAIGWWVQTIRQPKHVVLTVRNNDTLRKPYVEAFKQAWKRLRGRKIARGWQGGFWTLELTNEGRGWHLHLHAVIDARWIDAKALAEEWAKCTGQDFAIVKVKDCRSVEYLQEVLKYTVKGTDLATWAPGDLVDYIDAFIGVRTFGTFGSLYNRMPKYKQWLDELQLARQTCPCGGTHFSYHDARIYDLGLEGHPTLAPPEQTLSPQLNMENLLPDESDR